MYSDIVLQNFKNRAETVLQSREIDFKSELKIFYDFIRSNDITNTILTELESQNIDLSDWESTAHNSSHSHIPFPDDYIKKIFLCNNLMKKILAGEITPNNYLFRGLTRSNSLNDICQAMAEKYFSPLCAYIYERIYSVEYFLYLLLKYKNKCEWFGRNRLYEIYKSDTPRGEDNLTNIFQEYLLDQGIDYPFSTPHSPHGRADIVSLMTNHEPIPLEIKLFLRDKNYDKNYIQKGFRQAYRYACDYCKNNGYLLIFNLDDVELVIDETFEKEFSNIMIGNINMFIVIINLFPIMKSASQEKEIKTYKIESNFLKEV